MAGWSAEAILGVFLLLHLSGHPVYAPHIVQKGQAGLQQIIDFAKANCKSEEAQVNLKDPGVCTAAQLQEFLQQLASQQQFEDYPRLFPFCVTLKQIRDPKRANGSDHIKKFEKIFEDIESNPLRFYKFNKTMHSTRENNKWIQGVKISRINTPELDMVNLRQWLHLEIRTADPTKGIYVQSIVGPMGLPFGEFYLDFPCKDDFDATKDIDVVGQLTHCSYRPRAALYHPSAFVGYDKNGTRTEWHTHFLWTDITCYEMPYAQFLILVVKDFDAPPKLDETYSMIFSPVYLNTKFDSISGAPFPYYPEMHDNMYCQLDNKTFNATYTGIPGFPSVKVGADPLYEALKWEIHDDIYRIQPSEVYDKCVTSDSYPDRDDDRFECPPGAFQCTESYAIKTNVTVGRVELVEKEKNLTDCEPCFPPTCEEMGFNEQRCENVEGISKSLFHDADRFEIAEKQGRIKAHGIIAILSFLVLQPLANYMGRFFKEMCPGCLCGNGPWIFIHILFHILALLATWLSLGPVTTESYGEIKKRCLVEFDFNSTTKLSDLNDESRKLVKGCIRESTFESSHLMLGLFAFLVQHLVLLVSFLRSSNNRIRNIQVALHSHMGYLTFFLGAAAAFTAAGVNCKEVLTIQLVLFILPLLFSGVAIVLDIMTDKKVGIIPPRKQWPVLEPVVLEGRGPFTMLKWIIYALFCFLQVVFWMLASVSANHITEDIEELLTKTADENTLTVDKRVPGTTAIYRGEVGDKAKRYKFDVDGLLGFLCSVEVGKSQNSAGNKSTENVLGNARFAGYDDYDYT